MNEPVPHTLISDPEFTALIQPVMPEALVMLEENLLDRGCQEPILAWGDIIIDGNKRFEVCTKYHIRYQVKNLDFPNRPAALSYLCSAQLQRKDLSPEYFKYLLGKKYLYDLEAAQDKEGNPIGTVIKYDTAHRIASGRNMSLNTIIKYGEMAQAVDRIRQKNADFAGRILTGEIKLSHMSIMEVSHRPREDVNYLQERLLLDGRERLRYNELYEELRLRHQGTAAIAKPKKEPGIRQMPKYDPEAEISSLILTIPSWVSSMERAHSRTNYALVSADSRGKIRSQLSTLTRIIAKIMRAIEEESL